MRHRSLVAVALGIFVQYSGNNLLSQYLVPILTSIGIKDSHTQLRYNVGTEAWGFLAALVMAAITPRFPRRRMYLLCASCLVLVYSGWTAAQARNRITGTKETGYAVLVFIFLYKPAYNIAYNALTYVYMVEIWPFYVRAKGLSLFQLSNRCSVMLGSFVNPIGLDDLGWKYLLVYVGLLCGEVVFIYFLFPETHGKTLEELTFLFESEKEEAEVLRKAAAKVVGGEGEVVELHERTEKTA